MKGDYVSFIDSDDYVGPDYLKTLMDLINEFNTPVAAVAHLCVYDETTSFIASKDTRHLIPNSEILKAMAHDQIIFSAWGKLIRKDLFAQHRFPVGMLFEDNLLMPYLLCGCDAIASSTSKQYYWTKRPDSIMGKVSEKKVSDWEEGIDRLLDFTQKNYPDSMQDIEGWIASTIWHISIDQLIFTDQYLHHASRIQEKYGAILNKSWNLPVVSNARKIKHTVYAVSRLLPFHAEGLACSYEKMREVSRLFILPASAVR